jgi:hypothetical protein
VNFGGFVLSMVGLFVVVVVVVVVVMGCGWDSTDIGLVWSGLVSVAGLSICSIANESEEFNCCVDPKFLNVGLEA